MHGSASLRAVGGLLLEGTAERFVHKAGITFLVRCIGVGPVVVVDVHPSIDEDLELLELEPTNPFEKPGLLAHERVTHPTVGIDTCYQPQMILAEPGLASSFEDPITAIEHLAHLLEPVDITSGLFVNRCAHDLGGGVPMLVADPRFGHLMQRDDRGGEHQAPKPLYLQRSGFGLRCGAKDLLFTCGSPPEVDGSLHQVLATRRLLLRKGAISAYVGIRYVGVTT